MPTTRLTLREAQEKGRIREFAAQAERDGIGPVEKSDFNAAVRKMVKAPQSKGRTSRSPSRGGSSGK